MTRVSVITGGAGGMGQATAKVVGQDHAVVLCDVRQERPRWGKPEEMGDLLAFCASAKAGYRTGTDILNDGGVVASMKERARVAAQNA